MIPKFMKSVVLLEEHCNSTCRCLLYACACVQVYLYMQRQKCIFVDAMVEYRIIFAGKNDAVPLVNMFMLVVIEQLDILCVNSC